MDRRQFLVGSSVAACIPGLYPQPSSARLAQRPNIVLIMTDEQSADVASAYMGSKYLRTPNMDALIASGTTYSRAYCANPICVPSRTSIFTGRYPTETGVMDNADLSTTNLTPAKFPIMGRVFRDQGYDTAYFGKWHITSNQDQANAHGFMRMATTFNDDNAAAMASAAFLREPHARPFLMVASFLDPHSICEWARGEEQPLGKIGDPPAASKCPPLPFNHGPQKDEPDIMTFMRRSYQSAPMFPVGDFTEEKWRQYLWAYYRMVERTDALVGTVTKALRDAGLEDNTIIVFTSDHGDSQGAHGWNQKTVFYEESARVPFVISRKGAPRLTSKRLVNTGIDLIPTLCDFAGISIPGLLPGISVSDPNSDPRKYVVVSNRMIQGAAVDGKTLTPDGRMLRGERYKYCVYSEGRRRESLVDMDADPGEMVNLVGHKRLAPVLREHRALLAGWCKQTGDTFQVPAA